MQLRTEQSPRAGLPRKIVAVLALLVGMTGTSIVVAPAAQAADGHCGYYSETRAVNSKSVCKSKKLASYIKVDGKLIYAPWALAGQTSWQQVNYASVQAYDYIFRPV